MESWKKVFFVAAAIYGVNNLFYLLFAQGTEQAWNRSKDEDSKQESKHNYCRNIETGSMVDCENGKAKENPIDGGSTYL